MSFPLRSPLLRYSIALASVALATLLRYSLSPILGTQAPFFTYLIATMVTAWAVGFGPAVLTMALGAILSSFLFVEPLWSFSLSGKTHIINLVVYLTVGLIATLLSRELHIAKRRAEALALIVESSDDAIIGKTLDGIITSWNRGAEKLYGYTSSEAVGRHISFIVPDEFRPQLDEMINKIVRGEHIEHMDTRRIRKDGTIVDVSLTTSPIYSESGEIVGVSKIARDISVRKRLEQEREELLAREQEARTTAEAANRLKDEFLATVSHELRTPLTAILGWSLILRSKQLDAGGSEHALEVIERNARIQKQIIDDLLDVSRIISGKLRLTVSSVDLVPVLLSAIDAVRLAADAKEIQIETQFDDLDAALSGDADRLQQAVWNLLSNAVKFTPRGGRIEVNLRQNDSHAEIVVRDTGAGIKPDFQPFLFDRFRQADSSTTRIHGGLGLGLAIVRHLIELHGGTVMAESEGEGHGATFTIRLPVHADVAKRISPAGALVQAAVEAEKKELDCRPNLEGLKIMVVEDDADAVSLLEAIFTGCGARVASARSAVEAMELLKTFSPQILVCDIGLPGEDGYALIKKIRAGSDPVISGIPAVAVTAYARDEDRVRALAEGFQAHLAKPAEPNELLQTVANLCESAVQS